MTKKVTWNSSNRLACTSVTPAPTVIVCLTDPTLLAPLVCLDASEYVPTTLEATLTKAWRSISPCNQTTWTYVLSYDENLLLDPATALTIDQIDGVFCAGCITTYIEDKIRRILCEVLV